MRERVISADDDEHGDELVPAQSDSDLVQAPPAPHQPQTSLRLSSGGSHAKDVSAAW